MSNSASEHLLRAINIDKQPFHNYIDSYQHYVNHCKRTATRLAYFLILHIASTTIIEVACLFWDGVFSLKNMLLVYVGYMLWCYILLHYRTRFPLLDPHSLYNEQQKKLLIIHIDRDTFQLSLCLLLLSFFGVVHLFLTNRKLMLIADLIFIGLTTRSVFQNVLKEKQINRRMHQMENRRLYVIEPFIAADMKEPFEMEEIQSMELARKPSLNHLPQFMKSFLKVKKQQRMQSEVQHFDETHLYSH